MSVRVCHAFAAAVWCLASTLCVGCNLLSVPALTGQCSGQGAGQAGCPCGSDQDCSPVGNILLCVEGTCAKKDPSDVKPDGCSNDADCGTGEACAQRICALAPSCQRIDGTVHALSDDIDADITIAREDCNHTLAGIGEINIDRAGQVGGDCTGVWRAELAAGVWRCNGSIIAVAQKEPCLTTTDCAAGTCNVVDAATDAQAGVCR